MLPDHELIIPILACFLISGLLKGLTGIGFITVCLASLVFFVDLKTAITLTLLSSIVSNLIVMYDAGGFVVVIRRFWKLYVSALPGLFLGLYGLFIVDEAFILSGLAAVIFSFCVFSLISPKFELSERLAKRLEGPVGLAYGVIAGFTGSHVMPLLPYALSMGLSRNQYVQMVNTMFTLGAVVVGLAFWQGDVLTHQLVTLSMVCTVPTFIGVALGNAIRKRITSEFFRTATLFTLIGISMSLATRAAQAFGI